ETHSWNTNCSSDDESSIRPGDSSRRTSDEPLLHLTAPAVRFSRVHRLTSRCGRWTVSIRRVRSMTHSDSRANRDLSDDLRQAEQQLRERERQLESLMGHLPGLAYRALADEHWTALFASKGIEDLTGYPADEFTSRRLNYADIMLPEDRPATREAVF